ncbi:MAG: 4Fe-4S dicluster domain-containing protein [Candidatus Woesearchaeota archaeon]
MGKFIEEKRFDKFIDFLKEKYEVIAPVHEKGSIRFKILEEGDEIVFSMPYYPAKKFFLPSCETLFNFNKDKIVKEGDKIKKRVIFLEKCDAAALVMLDKIMLRDPVDPYYKKRRDNTLIIESPCFPDYSECFCDINKLPDNYDLRLVEHNGKYFFQVGSKKGKKLLEKAPIKNSKVDIKDIPSKCENAKCDFVLHEKEIKGKNEKIWKEEAAKCLSCGACTVVCPTCNCFEIKDELDANCKEGKRTRRWSSCQLPNFTQVAGGHVFRLDRDNRVKQRVLHKFKYTKEQFGEISCVGCGRCVAACPTKINIFEIVKKLK